MLMTISDLASRWGIGIAEAIRVVQRENVPFITLRTPDQYVRWSHVRFNMSEVERWEERRTRTFRGRAENPSCEPGSTGKEKRLGSWRS